MSVILGRNKTHKPNIRDKKVWDKNPECDEIHKNFKKIFLILPRNLKPQSPCARFCVNVRFNLVGISEIAILPPTHKPTIYKPAEMKNAVWEKNPESGEYILHQNHLILLILLTKFEAALTVA